jgi:hypothetical protein
MYTHRADVNNKLSGIFTLRLAYGVMLQLLQETVLIKQHLRNMLNWELRVNTTYYNITASNILKNK